MRVCPGNLETPLATPLPPSTYTLEFRNWGGGGGVLVLNIFLIIYVKTEVVQF